MRHKVVPNQIEEHYGVSRLADDPQGDARDERVGVRGDPGGRKTIKQPRVPKTCGQ